MSTKIQVVLDDEIKQKLEKEAKGKGVKVGTLVRMIIIQHLKKGVKDENI